MNASWVWSDHRLSLCWPAYHVTLSWWLVSQRPPTLHCAMPRPGPPPNCFAFGLTDDSWMRFPTMPADWRFVSPRLTKKLNAVCVLLDSSDSVVPSDGSSGSLAHAARQVAATRIDVVM